MSRMQTKPEENRLLARRLGLHSHEQPVAIIQRDCPISRREGLATRSQVLLTSQAGHVRAILYHSDDGMLGDCEIGLSEAAWKRLSPEPNERLLIAHAPRLDSLSWVRHRIHGNRLSPKAMNSIVADVVAGDYTEVHLAAFLTATSAFPLDDSEVHSLTAAMVETGQRLSWDKEIIVDKHSLGGLPGNRTTPIIVAIVACFGLTMPKTSSRAITSPAGTADTMATMANVDLSLERMRQVVGRTGACIAWGGAVNLSPADDLFIGAERMLDIDPEGQLIASVLSKKVAAGATHVVIDIPVGPTAKVRSTTAARQIARRLANVAAKFGLTLACIESDGTQPVGRGIGPALEAHDVLAVLRGDPHAPVDLRQRACLLAGRILEMGGAAEPGTGAALAEQAVADESAWKKFSEICEAQGGFRQPGAAAIRLSIPAAIEGTIIHADNRKIAQVAKLAGAPDIPTAGVFMDVRLGDEVVSGQPLLTIHADSIGDARYALKYAQSVPDLIGIAK